MGVLRRAWPIAAVTVLLAVVALGAALGSLPLAPISAPSAEADQPTFETIAPPARDPSQVKASEVAGLPHGLVVLSGTLCAALILIVVGLVVFQLLRNVTPRRITRPAARPRTRQPDVSAVDSVVAAVTAGIEELDANDSDPRRAVIACWVRLEAAAAAAGTERSPGDSPTDLVLRLLTGHRISGVVLNGFADVYRQARYAPHVVDASMRDQARAALRQLRDELRERVVAE